jgi:ferredoxin
MIRTIIEIDEEKCNGCGLCAKACHEGAIGMVNGKAKLLRDDYCDGLGDCLPACPTGAIRFVEREAAAYDAQAVAQRQQAEKAVCGCAGSQPKMLLTQEVPAFEQMPSQLRQWPVQIKLAPIQAPYFDGAELLIAADCAAYAHGDFHRKFMHGKITLIGCPKLDGVDYAEKLGEILRQNQIARITVVRMQVPCCGGLEHAVRRAIAMSGKALLCEVVTLSVDGNVIGTVSVQND